MEGMEVKRLKIRELLPEYGDRASTITVEEAEVLDFSTMITIFPHGEVVHSYQELIDACRDYHSEELEVLRFYPLAGG